MCRNVMYRFVSFCSNCSFFHQYHPMCSTFLFYFASTKCMPFFRLISIAKNKQNDKRCTHVIHCTQYMQKNGTIKNQMVLIQCTASLAHMQSEQGMFEIIKQRNWGTTIFRSYQHYRFIKLLSKLPAHITTFCIQCFSKFTTKKSILIFAFCNSLIGFFFVHLIRWKRLMNNLK